MDAPKSMRSVAISLSCNFQIGGLLKTQSDPTWKIRLTKRPCQIYDIQALNFTSWALIPEFATCWYLWSCGQVYAGSYLYCIIDILLHLTQESHQYQPGQYCSDKLVKNSMTHDIVGGLTCWGKYDGSWHEAATCSCLGESEHSRGEQSIPKCVFSSTCLTYTGATMVKFCNCVMMFLHRDCALEVVRFHTSLQSVTIDVGVMMSWLQNNDCVPFHINQEFIPYLPWHCVIHASVLHLNWVWHRDQYHCVQVSDHRGLACNARRLSHVLFNPTAAIAFERHVQLDDNKMTCRDALISWESEREYSCRKMQLTVWQRQRSGRKLPVPLVMQSSFLLSRCLIVAARLWYAWEQPAEADPKVALNIENPVFCWSESEYCVSMWSLIYLWAE